MSSIESSTTIDIVNVTKCYLGKQAISDVSTSFSMGTLNLLIGKNGSGKSTLIKCIMGTLRFQGEIIRKKTAIGYAPEDYVMPYYMSVRDFLESIGKIRDVESKRLKQEIDDHLNFFDMKSYEHRSFGALSNGMRQKVNLIQAFLNRPKTILLDEPLHGLDEESQKKVLKLVKSRLKDCLIIVSTHYPEHFKTRNKRVYQMIDGRLFIEQA